MQFTERTINFISYYFIRNLCKLDKIGSNEIIKIIIEALKTHYFNSFKNKKKSLEFENKLITSFKEKKNIKIIEEENERNEVEEITKTIDNIYHYLCKNDAEFDFFIFISG